MLSYLLQFCKTFPKSHPPTWQPIGAIERRYQGDRPGLHLTPSRSRNLHTLFSLILLNPDTASETLLLSYKVLHGLLRPAGRLGSLLVAYPVLLSIAISFLKPMIAPMFGDIPEASYA